MPDLPIRRMVLYKHGVGYFERRGLTSGESLRLSFPLEAMDDVLKSLIVLDLGAGQVHGVDFETPEDREAQLARGSIHLSDNRSMLDLLRDLRGRQVRITLDAGAGMPDEQIEGLVIGVDIDEEHPLRQPLVSLYQTDLRQVRAVAVRGLRRVEILDGRAAEDLDYFLRVAQSEADRRVATVRLSPGDHDLLVGYVAPAPAWRVSYRLLAEPDEPATPPKPGSPPPEINGACTVLLQGWGLFDNQLNEDLEHVELTLVAGMPVSFRYRLYDPHTPERPLVVDEERTVAAPIEFDAVLGGSMPMAPPAAAPMMAGAAAPGMALDEAFFGSAEPQAKARRVSAQAMESTVNQSAAGAERGALFQYRVTTPVSVGRGQSAMAPIVSQRLDGRKELLYNGQKLAKHPVASLRLRNTTDLTLERGPVTVIEVGDYAGEAVLPFTRTGAEMIVPYAVELGISVTERQQDTRQIGGIKMSNGYMQIQEWEIQTRAYQIGSTLSKPVDVLIEQALLTGYTLFDTPEPSEFVQGNTRWKVACPPNETALLIVKQRRQVSRREQVRNLNGQQLANFLRDRFLDEPTFGALQDVLAIYDQIQRQQQRLRQIEQERKTIGERQRQIQGNMTPLRNNEQEGALRTRYVTQLGELEDQLGTLAAEEQKLRDAITALEARADRALLALSA
ncbi:MAG: hypothetical protein OHK0022_49490 [Roseiflexaceae bacterium]